jgi:hypothetical protein
MEQVFISCSWGGGDRSGSAVAIGRPMGGFICFKLEDLIGQKIYGLSMSGEDRFGSHLRSRFS